MPSETASDRFIFIRIQNVLSMKEIRLKNSKYQKNILNFLKNSAIIFFVQLVGTASRTEFSFIFAKLILKGNDLTLA